MNKYDLMTIKFLKVHSFGVKFYHLSPNQDFPEVRSFPSLTDLGPKLGWHHVTWPDPTFDTESSRFPTVL